MGAQSLIWFGVAGAAAAVAASLLYARYVRKESRAVRSRGGFTLFALCLLLFSAGATAAGIASVRAGR